MDNGTEKRTSNYIVTEEMNMGEIRMEALRRACKY